MLHLRTYNYLFPVDGPYQIYPPYPPGDDIDIKAMMSIFEKVIQRPEMKKKDSVVVLNVGLHLSRTLRLQSAFAVIDAYIAKAKQHNINIIWRGQNAVTVNGPQDAFWRQFITNPVSVFCKF